MKIAIVIPLFLPKWIGGAEIATYNLAKRLAEKGHEIYVITSSDKGLAKQSKQEGFYVCRMACSNVRFLKDIIFWLKGFLLLWKISPDIVHAQSLYIGIPGLLAKTVLKKTFVVWGHGSDVYLPWPFKRVISRLVLRTADVVVALTNDMKKEMLKTFNRRICVIPNGINMENYSGLSRDEARRKLNVKKDDKIILFIGNLRPLKGVRYLIEAMAEIRKGIPGTRLMIVGEGEERLGLERLARSLDVEKEVTFVGAVPNENVPEYLVSADVFVLPSLSESFSIVTLEAMAVGLPVIASHVGGLPEILTDGENGLLVEPGNPAQLAQGVLALLKDDGMRSNFAMNNKEKAKRYSWAEVAEKLQMVYEEAYLGVQPD